MCDYSLQSVQSRAAKIDDKLTVKNFGTGTRGFAAAEDSNVAVCLLPGTEIAFDKPVTLYGAAGARHTTAIFRQVNKEQTHCHHDTLEFPDGGTALLTFLTEGQTATVLQLPAPPKTRREAEEQRRAEYVG